jgi:hypothetical protein
MLLPSSEGQKRRAGGQMKMRRMTMGNRLHMYTFSAFVGLSRKKAAALLGDPHVPDRMEPKCDRADEVANIDRHRNLIGQGP